MARRAGAQQLQTEIKTDEDLEKFLTRSGLLVLEVYSEWCGPCLGMVGTLRRVKIEMAGDNLHLATCRSDTVTALKRFNKRSEPVWIFATNGRAVGIFFGTDAPKLVASIMRELEKTLQNAPRPTYGIGDLQPVEAEALRIKTEAIERAERTEREKEFKNRMDYLTHCTDVIMENLPDIGVTLFGPQVSRDMFKKLSEPAEQLKMQCKDRKYLEVSAADFDVINFACKNPLSPDIIEQLDGRELLVCFWKIDESAGPIPHVLATYAHELTKDRVAPPDDEHPAPYPIPPIIAPLKIKFEVEVEEGEIWVDEISSEEEARLKALEKKAAEKSKSATHFPEEGRKEEIEEAEEEGSEEEEVVQAAQPVFPDMPPELDFGLDDDVSTEDEFEEEESEAPKPMTRTKRVKIPPIWVANNRRTHAALIYVFFRSQTNSFLPPDPAPEPPHVIMAFEAHKRGEILEMMETIREDVPQYGFFTSDTPGEAKLISNSVFKYNEMKNPTPDDRFVLKVNKVQSYTMLSLVQFEPTYCSSNVTAGKADAIKFFPEDYRVDEEVPVEVPKKVPKKKKKAGADSEAGTHSRSPSAMEVPPAEPPTVKEEAAPAPAEAEAHPAPEVQAVEAAPADVPPATAPAPPAPTEGEVLADAAAPADAVAPAPAAGPEAPSEAPAAEAAEPPAAESPPPPAAEAPSEPAPAE